MRRERPAPLEELSLSSCVDGRQEKKQRKIAQLAGVLLHLYLLQYRYTSSTTTLLHFSSPCIIITQFIEFYYCTRHARCTDPNQHHSSKPTKQTKATHLERTTTNTRTMASLATDNSDGSEMTDLQRRFGQTHTVSTEEDPCECQG